MGPRGRRDVIDIPVKTSDGNDEVLEIKVEDLREGGDLQPEDIVSILQEEETPRGLYLRVAVELFLILQLLLLLLLLLLLFLISIFILILLLYLC